MPVSKAYIDQAIAALDESIMQGVDATIEGAINEHEGERAHLKPSDVRDVCETVIDGLYDQRMAEWRALCREEIEADRKEWQEGSWKAIRGAVRVEGLALRSSIKGEVMAQMYAQFKEHNKSQQAHPKSPPPAAFGPSPDVVDTAASRIAQAAFYHHDSLAEHRATEHGQVASMGWIVLFYLVVIGLLTFASIGISIALGWVI